VSVSLSVKNVSDDIARRLKARAARNHRSLQGELLAVLEQAAGGRRFSVEEVAREVKRLKIRTSGSSTRILRELRDGR
jgi:plasmid stability protein